ncbi:MAG: HAD family hydrolase [Pseudohongiellaceae bacterium]|jgi:HAD superfamily hydrolase (TIGR01490 family)
MPRQLALFDLDNTLLAGDSDHAWGEFLIQKQLVDAENHRRHNDTYYQQYQDNELDIHAYVRFTMGPILDLPAEQQLQLRDEYMTQMIAGLISDASRDLVARHRDQGDFCLIITATNSFLTTPIAAAYQVDQLLATDLQLADGRVTGDILGIPCFQAGKVQRLQQWLAEDEVARREQLRLADSIFYSDSSNDLPLLEQAGTAVVVDPDERLKAAARERNWQELSLHP